MVPYPPRLKPLVTHECRYGALIQQSNGCSSCAAWGKSLAGRKQCKYCRWDYFEHGSSFSWNFFQMDWTDLVAKNPNFTCVDRIFEQSKSNWPWVWICNESRNWRQLIKLISSPTQLFLEFWDERSNGKMQWVYWMICSSLVGKMVGRTFFLGGMAPRWNKCTQNMKLLSYDLYIRLNSFC